MKTKLVIPAIPPSVNHYWGSNGNRRFLTQRARQWKVLVKECCSEQLIENFVLIQKRVKIIVTFYIDSYRGDLDNRLKAVLDSLNGVVWQDDRLVDEITVTRKRSVENKTVLVIADVVGKKEKMKTGGKNEPILR